MLNKKAFVLSIVLWMIVIFMITTAIVLSFAKKSVNLSSALENKLLSQLEAKSTLEIMKYYTTTTPYEYITFETNKMDIINRIVTSLPDRIIMDGREYNISKNTTISILDSGGLYNGYYIDIDDIALNVYSKIREYSQYEALKNSLKDWLDRDEFISLNGAETFFYKINLKKEFGSRNKGYIDNVDELFSIYHMKNNHYLKTHFFKGYNGARNIFFLTKPELSKYFDNWSSLYIDNLISIRSKNLMEYLNIIKSNKKFNNDLFGSVFSGEYLITIKTNIKGSISVIKAVVLQKLFNKHYLHTDIEKYE